MVVRDDDVSKAACLMTLKTDDPLKKGEKMASDLRRIKKKELLLFKKPELFDSKTHEERSVSPISMGEMEMALPQKLVEDWKKTQEESKQEHSVSHTADITNTRIRLSSLFRKSWIPPTLG